LKGKEMIDSSTRKPIRVLMDEATGPYIWVSVKHLQQVSELLSRNGVSFWVDHHAVSVDGQPAVTVINVRRGTDPQQVQALLDAA
jgi:hypothetical protein